MQPTIPMSLEEFEKMKEDYNRLRINENKLTALIADTCTYTTVRSSVMPHEVMTIANIKRLNQFEEALFKLYKTHFRREEIY